MWLALDRETHTQCLRRLIYALRFCLWFPLLAKLTQQTIVINQFITSYTQRVGLTGSLDFIFRFRILGRWSSARWSVTFWCFFRDILY